MDTDKDHDPYKRDLTDEQIRNIVGPWPSGPDSEAHLKMESGMDKFLGRVMDGMKNCRVYVHLKTDVSRFCADFFVVTANGDKMHTGQYMTSWLAIGMNEEQVVRAGDIVIKALASSLGIRIFAHASPTIPSGAMIIKDMVK